MTATLTATTTISTKDGTLVYYKDDLLAFFNGKDSHSSMGARIFSRG